MQSSTEAVEVEKLLTLALTPGMTPSEESPMQCNDGAEVDIIASYDYGWQKKAMGNHTTVNLGMGLSLITTPKNYLRMMYAGLSVQCVEDTEGGNVTNPVECYFNLNDFPNGYSWH
ncbi:uncharacterized protein LOC124156249 [Ischnura elegans]|uniref:uncharacterized protein LOC124156249 n=1 Tax=Ischnura elegans TaxID=197161 RepID=UPI001ED87BE5|nr:uncharacterized protein LOC124156249 [Ischnura elegans]